MTFSTVFAMITLAQVFAIVAKVFAVLYIVFSCRHYNENINAGLCVLAVFFPLIAVIVQLSRKKHFQGEGMKVCRQCGEKLPPSFEVCPRCLAPLEPYDEAKAKKNKTLSDVMLAVFSVGKVLVVVFAIVIGCAFLKAGSELADSVNLATPKRISVTVDGKEVYFDKYGNSYDDADDVVLYSKDGTKYVYDDECFSFVSDKNEEYESIFCFVDSDGWFYYDAEDTLNYKTPEDVVADYYAQSDILDVGLDELLSRLFSSSDLGVEYDDSGKLYYAAMTASWNEKGELITEQYEAMP